MIVKRKMKGAGILLLLMMMMGLWGCAGTTEEPVVDANEAAAVPPTATTEPTQAPTLPPAVIVELPTNTPVPATNTPVPTDTPTAVPATETPTAIPPTNTAVYIPPTSTSVPPTNTPAPTAIPIGVSGLIASQFALQDRSSYTVNGSIWFEFTVANSTGGDVPYNALGVMPRKDGADVFKWYAQTYGGDNSRIRPGGLTWTNHIELGEPGNYTLRLVVCFDGFDNCLAGGGRWHTLSQEIPVTIK